MSLLRQPPNADLLRSGKQMALKICNGRDARKRSRAVSHNLGLSVLEPDRRKKRLLSFGLVTGRREDEYDGDVTTDTEQLQECLYQAGVTIKLR